MKINIIDCCMIAVVVLILVATTIICCSCSMMLKPGIPTPTFVEPPTPGVQLWQAARKSNWLATASILGIAAGVFALVNGSAKLGMASIASASVSLFMVLAVSRFALWMAVFGLVGSIATALFSVLVRRKALVEIIRGVQDIRVAAGTGNEDVSIKNNLQRNQSSTTKKIVGNIKNELRLKGEF